MFQAHVSYVFLNQLFRFNCWKRRWPSSLLVNFNGISGTHMIDEHLCNPIQLPCSECYLCKARIFITFLLKMRQTGAGSFYGARFCSVDIFTSLYRKLSGLM